MDIHRFSLGMLFGMDLARLWGRGRTREALDAGRIDVAGCLDAPEDILAGGWQSVQCSTDADDPLSWGIGPITFPREPLRGGKENA